MANDPLTTVEGFTARFHGDVQVCFDWDRFLVEQWPIERFSIRLRDQLAALEVPLCVDPSGEPCALDTHGARRVTVEEIPALLDQLRERAQLVGDYERAYRSTAIALAQLPAYRVGADGVAVLLMDGVHRSAGALLAEVPIEFDVYVVCGPLRPDCLADLVISSSP